MTRACLVLAPLALLACPGPKSSPDAAVDAAPPPAAWPAEDGAGVWLFPRPSEAGCVIERSDGGVVARFPTRCLAWSVVRHPTSEALLLWMYGAPAPVLWTPSDGPRILPALPALSDPMKDSFDYIGFGADGQVAVILGESLNPDLDEDAQTASVEFGGVRHDLDFESAMMFSPYGCVPRVLVGDAWQPTGQTTVVQLYEGMESPYCLGEEGLPPVVPDVQSSRSGVLAFAEGSPLPEDLPPYEDELSAWGLLKGADVAVGTYWFEGERFTSPLGLRSPEGAWTVHDFGDIGSGMTAHQRDSLLMACAGDGAVIVDRSAGNKIIWEHKGQCPAFWPLPTTLE